MSEDHTIVLKLQLGDNDVRQGSLVVGADDGITFDSFCESMRAVAPSVDLTQLRWKEPLQNEMILIATTTGLYEALLNAEPAVGGKTILRTYGNITAPVSCVLNDTKSGSFSDRQISNDESFQESGHDVAIVAESAVSPLNLAASRLLSPEERILGIVEAVIRGEEMVCSGDMPAPGIFVEPPDLPASPGKDKTSPERPVAMVVGASRKRHRFKPEVHQLEALIREVQSFRAGMFIFTNLTPSPIRVLRASEVSIELVATIDPGSCLGVSTRDGDHFVFFNDNALQPVVFTSAFDPDLSGFILKRDNVNNPVHGSQCFRLSDPSEVTTLTTACIESVITSVGRSVAKIDQLPLPKPLIALLKDAVENPSDYVRAKEFIVRYDTSLP